MKVTQSSFAMPKSATLDSFLGIIIVSHIHIWPGAPWVCMCPVLYYPVMCLLYETALQSNATKVQHYIIWINWASIEIDNLIHRFLYTRYILCEAIAINAASYFNWLQFVAYEYLWVTSLVPFSLVVSHFYSLIPCIFAPFAFTCSTISFHSTLSLFVSIGAASGLKYLAAIAVLLWRPVKLSPFFVLIFGSYQLFGKSFIPF